MVGTSTCIASSHRHDSTPPHAWQLMHVMLYEPAGGMPQQMPSAQLSPAEHGWLQPPQFKASKPRSASHPSAGRLLQFAKPGMHGPVTQVFDAHARAAPATGGQAWSQPPQ